MTQYLDGTALQVREPFDMDFIKKYGKVFRVFDGQDSGNLCFGTVKAGRKFFVKFAGAPTMEYSGQPQDAIARLKASLPVYQNLRHPCLIRLVEAEEIGGGFAMVFHWEDGDCMGRMYPESHARFLALPQKNRMDVFSRILGFLESVHSQGYVAIDFYDGSVMYDFQSGRTIICDVDFFARKPFVNHMGRLWGSSRFMSPEEFQLGAEIDEVTNVYTAGAMAFALFSHCSRRREDWPLGEGFFQLASRAVCDSRADRPQSIRELRELWQKQK